jgi:hypothetical protein
MQLAEFTEIMDRLLEQDPATFADGESLRTLYRYRARYEAWMTKATSTFEASGEWAEAGAQTAAAWLAVEAGLPKAEARDFVRLGKAMRQLPATEEAWLAGEIGRAQAGAIDRARNARTERSLDRDEPELVAHARDLRFEEFTRVLDYWSLHADPDGAEDRAAAQRRNRDAYLVPSFGGTWLGKLTFDPVSGAIVDNELRRLNEELFQSDWAEAKTRLGRDPGVGDLLRSAAQRRADAFVEMAKRSASMPPGARCPDALISVLIDLESGRRVCELAQGMVVTPGSLVPHFLEAEFERVVLSPPNRAHVGEKARLFKGATRRIVQVRDRTCQHPYCDRPAAVCQVDHIVPYSEGGPTTVENGRLLCEFHNRLRNQRPPPEAA